MTYLVPLYPQNKVCISCGIKVGFPIDRKKNCKLKLANPIGRTKQLEIFIWFNIITNHKHHVLCTSCFDKSTKLLNICTKTQRDKPQTYDELMQYLIGYNRKTLLNNEEANSSNRQSVLFYDISSEECRTLCGLCPNDIDDIAGIIHENPQYIFEFLTMCRQNISQRAAAVFFGYKSHGTISSHFNQILESLTLNFAPLYIGSGVFTRNDIKRNTPILFQELFPNAVGVLDGTYLYCQRSECFQVQRKTWSEQKRRNLVKIMGVQFANGRWFDLLGPFYADGDHNDASIWNYIVEEDVGNIHDIFNETTDEFIGDRGFRDVDDERFTVRIPLSLTKGQTQLSTSDANQTRKITKLRNSIERGFGRLKQWKIIGSIIDTNLIRNIGDLVRILGALDNKYFEPLFKSTDTDEHDIEFIKHREIIENVLEKLPTNQWTQKQFQEVAHLIPPLSLNSIRNYALGEYALKLAIPYLQHAPNISIKTHRSKQYSDILKIEGIT